mgnify:CR=1 FL=1
MKYKAVLSTTYQLGLHHVCLRTGSTLMATVAFRFFSGNFKIYFVFVPNFLVLNQKHLFCFTSVPQNIFFCFHSYPLTLTAFHMHHGRIELVLFDDTDLIFSVLFFFYLSVSVIEVLNTLWSA